MSEKRKKLVFPPGFNDNGNGDGVVEVPPDGIAMETRERNAIVNNQCKDEISQLLRVQRDEQERKHRPLRRRTDIILIYNCHGMVFGSRRCEINDAPIIRLGSVDD